MWIINVPSVTTALRYQRHLFVSVHLIKLEKVFELHSQTATGRKSSSRLMKFCITSVTLKTRLCSAKHQQGQESKRGAFSPEKIRIGVIWGLLCLVTGAGIKETLMMMKVVMWCSSST